MYLLTKWWRDIFCYPKAVLEKQGEDQYWEDRGWVGNRSLSVWQHERAAWALRRMDKTGSPVVVDVGSGGGEILDFLKQHIAGLKGIGIETAPEAMRALKDKGFEALPLNLSDTTTYQSIPTCDYALMFEIMEHVTESEMLVAVARNAARKGVFISVPNTGFFTFRLRLLFGKFPAQWAVLPNEHVRFWTLRDMHWWLGAQGITNAEVHTYQGVPLLKYVIPSWFAAGLVVYIPCIV
jgi:hypothetical protein